MRKQKAIINFTRVRDNDLPETSLVIYKRMFGNPDFPSPTPSMAELQIAINDYSDALIKSKDGTRHDTAEKNVKRNILVKCLADLGNYVNMVADGDIVKLDGSGFPLSKVPEHIGILPAPDFLNITEHPNSGYLNVEIAKVKRARGYIVLYFEKSADATVPENNSEWHSKLLSKRTGIIAGLVSGKKYVFKAAATSPEANKRGIYSFTSPIERFIA
jgi:hypothetical protein